MNQKWSDSSFILHPSSFPQAKGTLMSRAYRIKVSETVRRIFKAEDRVSTQLEILHVLPPAEMAELLRAELLHHGFEEQDGQLVREQDGVRILVHPTDGTVTVEAAGCETVELTDSQESW